MTKFCIVAPFLFVSSFACAESLEAALNRCRTIVDDRVRLACYDQAAQLPGNALPPEGSDTKTISQDEDRQVVPVTPVTIGDPTSAADGPVLDSINEKASNSRSLLSRQWDLDQKNPEGLFTLRPYRDNYLLPIAYNFRLNANPSTPSQASTQLYGDDLKHAEAQFQISLKTKLWSNEWGVPFDLWLGYTQKSYWQVYNTSWSSPFRETDYEPELMLTVPAYADLFGIRLRMLGLGLVHQSNGQTDPLSRSWNRIYAMAGLEHGDWSMIARGWYRIPEGSDSDDNPDISKYMGYGDLAMQYQWNDLTFGFLGRLNVASGYGGAQLDFTFPLYGYLRGYVRYFEGYGENLLDYNHHNRSLGIGFLLSDWRTR